MIASDFLVVGPKRGNFGVTQVMPHWLNAMHLSIYLSASQLVLPSTNRRVYDGNNARFALDLER